MSDLAKLTKATNEAYQPPYQHVDVVEVDGIELFESDSVFSESLPSLPNEPTKTTKDLPIKDAARVLGISHNSVRAKLKSGELSGYKVKGPTGERWLVKVTKATSELTKANNEAVEQTLAPEVSRLLDIIEKQEARLDKQSMRLEAASGQIGYLQSQLENSKETIALLEDRSKVSWWRRLLNSFSIR